LWKVQLWFLEKIVLVVEKCQKRKATTFGFFTKREKGRKEKPIYLILRLTSCALSPNRKREMVVEKSEELVVG